MAHSKLKPLQELLLPMQSVTDFVQQKSVIQQAFHQVQEKTHSYFQSFLELLETDGVGSGLKTLPTSLPPPSTPHPGLA